MHKLTKLFVAVVAGAFALSCVTDTTEDLGVKLGGQTEITISLEESRTQLGEQADGIYPLYWSEGDAISANGVASTALSATQAGSAAATFVINGELKAPYCITYPAAAANQVLFAAQQSHVGNTTFGAGVSTMYGYSEDGLNIELQHLTGVLKIGVTGSAVLSHAQISTIDRAPIAGAFDFDFATGEATATEASECVINYSFGDGVQLSNEATYLHVAVPAGIYNELYVTLFDNAGGVMYATVKADESKPLAVGKVRAFSQNIAFVAKNSHLFVISNAQTLKAFAEAAPTLEKDAMLVADVDMSAEEWTPIEGYTKTINGNGYAIKGLKAPLFGTTSAKIKGLHLSELNAEWATYTKAGAFAVNLTEGGVLSHCSTDGKIHINNTTYAEAVVRSQFDFIYGGLVGCATGATIEHCENNADITISALCAQSVAASGSHLYGFSFGGIVGAAELLDGGSATSISHVRNNGDVLLDNTTPLGRGYHWMGGVFGQTINDNALSAFHHCYNYGDIKTIKNSAVQAIRLGGVFGDLATNAISTIDFIENHGELNVHGTLATNTIQVYGIGYTAYILDGVNDCLNTGDITVQTNSKSNMYVCGGILGITASSETKGVCHRMRNEGDITVLPYNESSTISGSLTVVGLTNNMNCGLEGTEGAPSGNSGNITVTSTSTGSVSVAGVSVTLGEGSFSFKNVENSGNITINSTTSGTTDLYVSGVSTTNKTGTSFANVKNSGNISVAGSIARYVVVNGIGNEMRCTMNNVSNSGNVEVSATSGNNTLVYGVSRLVYAKATDVHNTGNVTVSGTATSGDLQAAGVFGALGNYSVTTDASNPSSNSGTITCRGAKVLNKDKAIRIAGYAVVLNYSKGMSNLLNKGNVVCEGNAENLAKVQLGGLACEINYATSKSENRGMVSATGTFGTAFNIGGIGVTVKGALTDVTNNGKLTTTATHTGTVRIGGIISDTFSGTNVTRAINTGALEMHGTASSSIGVAGMWPVNQTGDVVFTECHNSGNISVANKTTSTGTCHAAGLVGYSNKTTTFDGCSNTAESISVDNTTSSGYVSVAGAIGWCYSNDVIFRNGFTNSANIYAKPTQTYKYHASLGLPVGGVVAVYHKADAAFDWSGEIKNTGIITFEGAAAEARLGVGGVVGISNATATCEANLVNTGKIVLKKEAVLPATYGFGGIFGIAAGSIKGAKCFCNVEAIGNDYAFGFITGSSRSEAVKALNCYIGGGVARSMEVIINTDGDPIGKAPSYLTMDEESFIENIYCTAVSKDVAAADGCGYISSIDATPVVPQAE